MLYNQNVDFFTYKEFDSNDRMNLLIFTSALLLILIVIQGVIIWNASSFMDNNIWFNLLFDVFQRFVKNDGDNEIDALDTLSDKVVVDHNADIDGVKSDIVCDSDDHMVNIRGYRIDVIKNPIVIFDMDKYTKGTMIRWAKFRYNVFIFLCILIVISTPIMISLIVDKRNGLYNHVNRGRIEVIFGMLGTLYFIFFVLLFYYWSRVLFILSFALMACLLLMILSINRILMIVLTLALVCAFYGLLIYDIIDGDFDKFTIILYSCVMIVLLIILLVGLLTEKFHLFLFVRIIQSEKLNIDKNSRFGFNEGSLIYDKSFGDCNFMIDNMSNILLFSNDDKSLGIIGTFMNGILYINKNTRGLLYDVYYDDQNSVNFLNVRINDNKIGNIRSVLILDQL